jgi:hypothetical protein
MNNNINTADPRHTILRAVFDKNEKDKDYKFYVFDDANGKGATFFNCDFSYCFFENAYFHEAKFENCKFIGIKIKSSNFRNCTFIGCDFKFATFIETILPIKEILKNLPTWPNVRSELLQNLRVNANETGDTKNISLIIKEEIKSDKEHWRLARKRPDLYYTKKYSGFLKRIKVYYESFKIWIDWFIWGHGEFPMSLIRSIILTILIFSVWIFLSNSHSLFSASSFQISSFNKLISESFRDTINYFFDLKIEDKLSKGFWWLLTLSIFKYLYLGLFINIIMKKFSRR